MKRCWPLIGSTVTAAMVISVAPAAADESDHEPRPAIEVAGAAAEEVVEEDVVEEVDDAIDEAIDEATSATLVIPVDTAPQDADPVPGDVEVDAATGTVLAPTVEEDSSITLSLPVDEVEATGVSGDVAVFEGEDATYTSAVKLEEGGAFRTLVHIDSPAAPTQYAFDLTLPEGATLVERTDGAVDVRTADGEVLGGFAPAWAVAADGQPVPSSYEVRGHTLVQRIALSPGLAFPVVADPFWIPFLLILARFTAHAARQAAARGVSQSLVRQVIQNGRRTAGNGNTSVYTQGGSGSNRIRVVVDNRTGNIITVTKG